MSAKDYSRDAFAARLGPDVLARIEAAAASAPDPRADELDTLRRIVAPAVARLEGRAVGAGAPAAAA